MSDPGIQPLVVLNTNLVPPGGWKYTQFESKAEFKSIGLMDLKKQIRKHREANGYDLKEGWWDQVQLELCIDLNIVDSHCGFAQPDPDPPDPLRMKVTDLLHFFRVMREWIFKHGFKKESLGEAERRGGICVNCPMNREVKGCLGCQGISRWLEEYLGRHGEDDTTHHEDLQNCAVCKCVLPFKIYAPLDALRSATPDLEKYPPHCWMHGESGSPG